MIYKIKIKKFDAGLFGDWTVLREDTDPVRLLKDFIADVNDDFSEFDHIDVQRDYYVKLVQINK